MGFEYTTESLGGVTKEWLSRDIAKEWLSRDIAKEWLSRGIVGQVTWKVSTEYL